MSGKGFLSIYDPSGKIIAMSKQQTGEAREPLLGVNNAVVAVTNSTMYFGNGSIVFYDLSDMKDELEGSAGLRHRKQVEVPCSSKDN